MPQIDPDACVQGHTAYIYDRGGQVRLDQLMNLNSVQWGRDRDSVSQATVKITGQHCDAARRVLRSYSSKRHELVLFRGEERVWEGPLHRIGDQGGDLTIVANDVGHYLFAQPLTQTWDNTGSKKVAATKRLYDIIQYEMTHGRDARKIGGGVVHLPAWENLVPPVNIVGHVKLHSFPNEAQTAAITEPMETSVGLHLAGFARSGGIDWTVVGRAIHLWDTSRSIGQTRRLTEADFFGPMTTSEYGADHTQVAVVSTMEGLYGEAANPENLDFYGPWTTFFTSYHEEGSEAPTQVELDSQATRNTSGRSPVPMEVRVPDGSSLRLDDTLTIADLVPGARVPLLATLNARNYEQLQKLDKVVVTETADGETVQITLSPATRPDSDLVEA